MPFKKAVIILIPAFLILFSQAIGDDTVYRSEHYIIKNPRITYGGCSEARSEHYILKNVQIGNMAGGKAKSEHYTIEAFPVTRKLPPKPPTINQPISLTNNPNIALSGMKDKNTSICINGYEIIPVTADTTWSLPSYNLGEEDGIKTLSVTSKNKYKLESPSVLASITLDRTPPIIAITSPTDNAIINEAPITVTGTINEECDVIVNGVPAEVTGNIFTAEEIDLMLGENIITASGYDLAGNSAADSITVTSTITSDYSLTKLTSDIYEYDPTAIIAGSQVQLAVKLEIDKKPAPDEPVQFQVTQGNGSIAYSIVYTDANGTAAVMLNTDTNAQTSNLAEAFAQNSPEQKVTFHVDTKPGLPAQLLKITNEAIHPVPGAGIDLIARLTDANNNPIEGEEVVFQIISGGGSLSSDRDTTKDSGEARTTLNTMTAPNASCAVHAKCSTNQNITADFVITTSGQVTVTLDDIDDKVSYNNAKIQDIMADVNITSNAPWLAPETHLKIWRKGAMQKTQEISPKHGIYIKPMAQRTKSPIPIIREIISFDASTHIYVIKTKKAGQAEKYPYEIGYIDYDKGVVTKTEYYTKNDDESVTKYTKTASDYALINGAWVFKTIREEWSSDIADTVSYITTSSYSNITVNSGIPENIFE